MRRLALVLAAMLAAAGAAAQDNTFRSPSGNIGCFAYDEDGMAGLRCDIAKIAGRPLRRPADCELDFGQAFAVRSDSRRGAAICHGDTVLDPNAPALAYGQTWRWRDLSCASSPAGLRCANARGAGFELSREKQRVF